MTVRIGYSILDALQGPAGPCEIVSESEAEAIYIIERLNLELVKSLAKDGKPTERDQHPKQHGFVTAKFTVLKDHCKDQRIGLFLEPRTYTAVIRFSNSVGHDDAVPDNHGMAIKLLGVKGEKLLPDEMDAKTQDFVLLDHPLFFTENVSTLAAFSLDREALVKEKRLQGQELFAALAQTRPKEVRLLESRRTVIPSPLATNYFSTTPYKFGDTAVKYRATPESPDIVGEMPGKGENYLRQVMVEQLTTRKQPATFGFYIQRWVDPEATPIEDPTVEWKSEWEKVATIEISAQEFDFPERETWGNALSYTPWHALKEHRPLGGINRARKVIYPASSKLRHTNLGVPRKEPTEADIPMKKSCVDGIG